MNILLKKATIIDPKGDFHLKEVDVFISDGQIEKIGTNLSLQVDKIISIEKLHLSVGWFDSSVCFGEPGFEERETLDNGLKTAALSGFTDLGLEPVTSPYTATQSAVVQLKKYKSPYPTALHPIASFTQQQAGENLTEFFDLQSHGAIAFGDFLRPIKNPELLKTALLYAQGFDGLILSTPFDNRIGGNLGVHEGEISTKLGLRGAPSLNETLQIQRDLHILAYTGGKLHIPCISTAKGVALIREGKKSGLQVSCSVALANICYTDSQLIGFDTTTKLHPPLRTSEDCEALKEGLLDGTIDMITSHHQPLNPELKRLEFEYAECGTIGLEAMFGVLNTLFPLEKTIHLLSRGRSIFGLEEPKIAEGEKANISLFTPHPSSTIEKEHLHSSNHNCIFLGHKTQGKVVGIIREDNHLLK